ncbi:MAG: L-rhamnose mutarotase [Thermoplasmatales archaeon]|nr:L-rhamnose mutarotase [Thermoplasmatales archaeon]
MRHFFHLKIREDRIEEYKRRHQNVWPEMIRVLKESGIKNYSIFLEGTDVYGYWECENIDQTLGFLTENAVNNKWQEYMSDIILTTPAKRLAGKEMEVFYLE